MQFDQLKRRSFITLLGGATAAWPLAASPQQLVTPVVGFLGLALGSRERWLAAFRRGLGAEGFVDRRNVLIEYRSADGGMEGLRELAADLVRLQVTVIFASGPPAARAVKRATQTIPIVFLTGGDPIQLGLVSSFNRPDGNATGFYIPVNELPAKRLALLHELLPAAKRIAVLVNHADAATAEPTTRDVAVAGRALGLEIEIFKASTNAEVGAAFAALSSWRPNALLVGSDPLFNSERAQLVALAARHALPASYFNRDFVEAGGLMSYGPDYAGSYHQAGAYVGLILKGARPADLPVQQPTKLELVINLKTAKALGLAIPDRVLALADEVIE
jgi:putative tryptophan/tyrosine transport system substrate-binding protein